MRITSGSERLKDNFFKIPIVLLLEGTCKTVLHRSSHCCSEREGLERGCF